MPEGDNSRYNGNGTLVAAGLACVFVGLIMVSLGAPDTYVVLKPRRWGGRRRYRRGWYW